MEKDTEYFKGLQELQELPKMVIVIGNSKEAPILRHESQRMGVYYVSISDINSLQVQNGEFQTYIPCNTSSINTIQVMLQYIAKAIMAGLQRYLATHSVEDRTDNIEVNKTNHQVPPTQAQLEEEMLSSIVVDTSSVS